MSILVRTADKVVPVEISGGHAYKDGTLWGRVDHLEVRDGVPTYARITRKGITYTGSHLPIVPTDADSCIRQALLQLCGGRRKGWTTLRAVAVRAGFTVRRTKTVLDELHRSKVVQRRKRDARSYWWRPA